MTDPTDALARALDAATVTVSTGSGAILAILDRIEKGEDRRG